MALSRGARTAVGARMLTSMWAISWGSLLLLLLVLVVKGGDDGLANDDNGDEDESFRV